MTRSYRPIWAKDDKNLVYKTHRQSPLVSSNLLLGTSTCTQILFRTQANNLRLDGHLTHSIEVQFQHHRRRIQKLWVIRPATFFSLTLCWVLAFVFGTIAAANDARTPRLLPGYGDIFGRTGWAGMPMVCCVQQSPKGLYIHEY